MINISSSFVNAKPATGSGTGNMTWSPEDNDNALVSDDKNLFGGEIGSGSVSNDNNNKIKSLDNNLFGVDGDDGNDNTGNSNNNNNDNGDNTGNSNNNDERKDGKDNTRNSNNNNNDDEKVFASSQGSPIKVFSSNIAPNVSKLAIGDVTSILSVDPSHLMGIQLSMNLTGNRTQLVAAELTAKGMEHAVIVNLTKLMDLHNGKSTYGATFGSPINGTNPFTGKPDIVNSTTNLLLRNNEMSDIQFNGTIGRVTVTNNNLP